jgi:hypothetical protein
MRAKLFLSDEYEVDDLGVVYSKKGKPLKPSTNRGGYKIINVMVNGKAVGLSVHTAVLRSFVPKPFENATVNHKDGNKLNNSLNNLEWVTLSENCIHSCRVLGNNVGTRNGQVKSVACYNKDGKLIKTYPALIIAAKEIAPNKNPTYTQNGIWRVLRGIRRTYLGYIWKYA